MTPEKSLVRIDPLCITDAPTVLRLREPRCGFKIGQRIYRPSNPDQFCTFFRAELEPTLLRYLNLLTGSQVRGTRIGRRRRECTVVGSFGVFAFRALIQNIEVSALRAFDIKADTVAISK